MTPSEQRVARDGSPVEVLLFELATQRFALPVVDVVEVVRAVAIRLLPNAPPVVEGIINLRGEVVPVLDIRARFGLAPKPLEISDHFVVASAGPRRVALRVDRAFALSELQALSMERAINLPRAIDHIAGVAMLADEVVLVHDLCGFLSEVESRQLTAALCVLPPAQERSA